MDDLERKKKVIFISVIFLVGLLVGMSYNYITTEKCELVEHGLTGCYNGCEYSNLPQTEYDECVMFCEQQYYIKYIEGERTCNKFQQFVR